MIINMTGGANPLNFKVVGGSVQPESPAENTLWVNTESPVTAWVFSATEPEEPIEGMLWFTCSMSAKVPFDALKSNGLMVYPSKCSQYISSAWQSREAMIYKDGAWQDWFCPRPRRPADSHKASCLPPLLMVIRRRLRRAVSIPRM